MASNILIHREYTNAFPAKLIIEYGQVRTENSNKPHGFGALNPESFTPFPKNPVISRFFRQIGMADELGSGMRKMMRYCKAFGGADPEMIEGDVFCILVKVPEFGKQAPKDNFVEASVRGRVRGRVRYDSARFIHAASGGVVKVSYCQKSWERKANPVSQ